MTDQLRPDHHEWIDSALARLGATASGPAQPVKIRPWSSVGTVDTDRGRLWFKANEPALAFEAELLVVLSHAAPGRVLKPLDRDSTSGWFLSADGGPTGAEVEIPVDVALDTIVEVQRASAEHVAEMLTVGAPDRHPSILPDVLDEAIAHPASGHGGRRCAAVRARFASACDRLADDGRLGVVNSDHKPAHLFVGPPVRIFDWGDAGVSHPLADLPFVEREFGAEAARRFVEAWNAADDPALLAAAGAAGELIEADVWLRTSAEGLARHPDGIDVALSRLADRLDAVPGFH